MQIRDSINMRTYKKYIFIDRHDLDYASINNLAYCRYLVSQSTNHFPKISLPKAFTFHICAA